MKKQRVYLDKCFWINLRDARANKTNDPAVHALMDGLVKAVKAGRCICPISDVLFLELLKQTDLQSRAATAELIDELSCGVTLIPHQNRVATEIAHLIHANSGHSVHALDTLVWSKLANVLGEQHPVMSAFATQEQLVIQKAFFDHMWSISLLEMMNTIGGSWSSESPYPEFAERLNKENALHVHQIKSFAQVYKDEVFGALELAVPIACDVLHNMAENTFGHPIAVTADERTRTSKEVHAFLRAIIVKQPVKKALRTLHLCALFHAAVRWNRTQKITANDLYDFHHAEAALSYCDVFLTDRPMHVLLTQRHLGIVKDFSCKVISSHKEAASWAHHP